MNKNKISFISELCQNHNGNFDVLKKMVYECAENGSKIIKLQNIFVKDLSYRPKFESGFKLGLKVLVIKRPFLAEKKRLKKLEISEKKLEKFINLCKNLKVIPSITCFNRGSVNMLYNLGFEHIKIASYDCSSYQLIREVSKKFKNIVISTGATYDDEIVHAANILRQAKINFNMLHCVTIYPTPFHELNLSRIKYIKKISRKNAGYSDHSMGQGKYRNLACKLAIMNGATILERHININNPLETRDGKVSIAPKDIREILDFSYLSFNDMKEYIKKKYNINYNEYNGKINRELSHIELLNRDYYKGRFTTHKNNRNIDNWDEVKL